jgi:hypothetical protein
MPPVATEQGPVIAVPFVTGLGEQSAARALFAYAPSKRKQVNAKKFAGPIFLDSTLADVTLWIFLKVLNINSSQIKDSEVLSQAHQLGLMNEYI